MKPGQAFPDRIKFEVDYCNVNIIIRFNNQAPFETVLVNYILHTAETNNEINIAIIN